MSWLADKLVAVSGVAKSLGTALGDTYVAGMWRHQLETQLLRRRFETTGEICNKARQYIAPTWSWASADGPVYTNIPPHSQSDVKGHIEDVHLYETKEITGQIRSGHPDLQGELKPMLVKQSPAEGVHVVVVNVTKAVYDDCFDTLVGMERVLSR